MALVQVNVQEAALVPADTSAGPVEMQLAAALAMLRPGAPVVVMIHGFRFSPSEDRHSPHRHILALDPSPDFGKAVSWPRHLGFGRGEPGAGLAIALGWEARGTIWQAWAAAPRAGAGLAALVALIRRLDPGRPVDLVAHSLGARVALAALPLLNAGDIGRAVLLAAAELQATAAAAMDSPAGRAAEVMNVTTRENDLFDFGLELLVAGGVRRGLGHGLPYPRANWVDLQLDHEGAPAALAELGFRISGPGAYICHWSAYRRPGVFALYRAFLFERSATSPAHLRAALALPLAPRWSRLLPRRPVLGIALPRLRLPRMRTPQV
ncbi:alpha/beta fold hydrolase [Frigidibacter mobilis]|uniref:Uncharacterized protein n=1 Tax=Frigidibacter mobilis TaxID=1335048 RepID=A0A159Z694_9RHOB|nr:alpha/beta fold hydrolase [Frigidibacter mobilis]AMY69954.1 hypothetical protein AKL17_2715 [Frigidibacter mobilis]